MVKTKRRTSSSAKQHAVPTSKSLNEKSFIIDNGGIQLDDSVCRVCLHASGTVKLFDELGTDEQFRYCTALPLEEDDGLPSMLCTSCTEQMRIAYEFRFQATYAERYFRETIFLPLPSAEDSVQNDAEAEISRDEWKNLAVLEENMQEYDELSLGRDVSEESLLDDKHFEELEELEEEENVEIGVVKHEIDGELEPQSMWNIQQSTAEIDSDGHAAETFETSAGVGDSCETEKPRSSLKQKKKDKSAIKRTVGRPPNSEKKGKVECNICGTQLTAIASLKQHLQKHTGVLPFSCEFCSRRFGRRTALNNHRRLHTGERPYSCDECIESFAHKDGLLRHKERDHINGELTHICHVCNEARGSKYSLMIHIRTQHPETVEKLSSSKKKSKLKSKEKKEESINVRPRRQLDVLDKDGKPLPSLIYCQVCQRGFACQWDLVAHQVVHKSVLTFECEVCRCVFEKKYALLNHLSAHENTEALFQNCLRFTANIDAKSDSDKTDIKQINAKQCYACDECGSKFSSKTLLDFHSQRRHLCGRTMQCPLCLNKTANSKSNLLLHLSQAHNFITNGERTIKNFKRDINCNLCGWFGRDLHQFLHHLDLHE